MRWTAEQYREYLAKGLDKKDAPQRRATARPGKAALKACDREFSLLMRALAADNRGIVICCTCGKQMPWKGTGAAHWGHWQSRGFNSTRWNPKNGGVQCIKCNTYLEGEKEKMRAYLEALHGETEVQKIEALAKMGAGKYSPFELGEMAKHFRAQANEIIKIKKL